MRGRQYAVPLIFIILSAEQLSDQAVLALLLGFEVLFIFLLEVKALLCALRLQLLDALLLGLRSSSASRSAFSVSMRSRSSGGIHVPPSAMTAAF